MAYSWYNNWYAVQQQLKMGVCKSRGGKHGGMFCMKSAESNQVLMLGLIGVYFNMLIQ